MKNSILKYCSVVDTNLTIDHSMNMTIVKFTNPDTNTNTFLVNSYIPPANSSNKIRSNNSEANFEALHAEISNLRENPNDELLLVGDLNARIGSSTNLLLYDRADEFELFLDTGRTSQAMIIPDSAPISHNRWSEDNCTNSHKKPLLDLCGSENLSLS